MLWLGLLSLILVLLQVNFTNSPSWNSFTSKLKLIPLQTKPKLVNTTTTVNLMVISWPTPLQNHAYLKQQCILALNHSSTTKVSTTQWPNPSISQKSLTTFLRCNLEQCYYEILSCKLQTHMTINILLLQPHANVLKTQLNNATSDEQSNLCF